MRQPPKGRRTLLEEMQEGLKELKSDKPFKNLKGTKQTVKVKINTRVNKEHIKKKGIKLTIDPTKTKKETSLGTGKRKNIVATPLQGTGLNKGKINARRTEKEREIYEHHISKLTEEEIGEATHFNPDGTIRLNAEGKPLKKDVRTYENFMQEGNTLKTKELLRSVQITKLQRLQQEVWKKNPLQWLEDRLKEKKEDFKWTLYQGAYLDHKWDGDIDPLHHAWKAIANKKWVGIEAATGTSKTYFLSRLVLWFLDVYENSLVVTSAPKEGQLKLHLWSELTTVFNKFKKIRPNAAMYSLKLRVDESDNQAEEKLDHSESWQAVGFVCGTGAEEESATRAQGFHRQNMLIICEETTGMPFPVLTAFKNTSVAENNIIVCVGNPDSELDALHQFCMLPNVHHVRISAFDYPNVVLKKEVIAGAVTQASIDRRQAEYGIDSPMYQSRVRGISPSQSARSLIRLEWINNAVGRQGNYELDGYNAMGVDVANSENGDKAAVVWGKGSVLLGIKEFQCPNATHLGYNIALNDQELAEKGYRDYDIPHMRSIGVDADCVGIDAVGVGVSTINCLLDLSLEVVALQGGQWDEAVPLDEEEKPLYKYANLRSQMWYALKTSLQLGEISIAINDEFILDKVRRELTVVQINEKGNYVAVEKKDDIKQRLGGKSPNIGDAIAYWNWMRKGYRIRGGALPFMGAAK